MPKKYIVSTPFGDEKVTIHIGKYASNSNTFIQLKCEDGEPFAFLTTNFEKRLPFDEAYVDTNNCPWAEQFIRKYGLGEQLNRFKLSGYCCYPLYKFYIFNSGD